MKQIRLIYICVCACVSSMMQAQNVDSMFATVPPNIMPLLEKTARLDLIDLYNSGLEAKTENKYGGQSVITKKTRDFLEVQTTDAGRWQLKLLPYERDSVAVCVHSLRAGSTSSSLSAWQRNWKPTRLELPRPTTEDFMANADELHRTPNRVLLATLKKLPIEAVLNDSTQTMTCRLSLGSLSREDREKATAYLREVMYDWNGTAFVKRGLNATGQKR